jgi:FkbM family methyltransferase
VLQPTSQEIRPWSEQMTEEDIHACYRLLLGRTPDADGWRLFQPMVGTVPFQTIVQALLFAPEFQQTALYQQLVNAARIPPAQLVRFAEYVQYIRPGDPISELIAQEGQYEPQVAQVFKSRLKQGMTFIDVGANVGFFTLLAAHAVGRAGKVFAFEPNPINCLTLGKSLEANQWNHVRLYPLAAAARPSLYVYTPLVGSNGQIQPIDLATETTLQPRQILVGGECLDNLIPADIRPDMIKIDVEGAEHLVLQGAQRVLREHRPSLVIEYTPGALATISQIDGPGFLRSIQQFGYEFQGIQLDGTLRPFGEDILALHRWCEQETNGHVDFLATPVATKNERRQWWGMLKR